MLREFLELSYSELEERNLEAKSWRADRRPQDEIAEQRIRYLMDEKRIKAVTVCFSDLEGRMHMLDYDKKFLIASADNLTFDGSSIRGFSVQEESDLKLSIDWGAFYWLPSDIFGPGKVFVMSDVCDRDGKPYVSDFRGRLRDLLATMYQKDGTEAFVAPETEGFLFAGRDAEQRYVKTGEFQFISNGGYFHSLPRDPLRLFIDSAADVQRALGFSNEKDHPEVAPSQFEMNYAYASAIIAADQIQLYKLLCRQIADSMDMTASFLPKPVQGVNGNGMHTNISLATEGKNRFYDKNGKDGLSTEGWSFVDRTLSAATDISLILNSSVNAYRRLDPTYEAPNQIKASANNRGAMVRIPLANERSARIEVRSVSPDANPYLLLYTLIKVGTQGGSANDNDAKRSRTRFLPDNIYDAMRHFKSSKLCANIMGEAVHDRYFELKRQSANRCPQELGGRIKRAEIQFHHEVTNQMLWNYF